MKCHVFRTAMCGGGLSYDVYVPVSECPKHVLESCPGGMYHTRITRGTGEEYLHYEDATTSEEHEALEQGIERWDSWKLHEARACSEMLRIARSVFPELNKVTTDRLPTLWVNGLMAKEVDGFAIVNREDVIK